MQLAMDAWPYGMLFVTANSPISLLYPYTKLYIEENACSPLEP